MSFIEGEQANESGLSPDSELQQRSEQLSGPAFRGDVASDGARMLALSGWEISVE